MGNWKHQHLVILDGDKTVCLVQDSDYAERIVQCVNACEGMEDPVKEIERLKAERNALEYDNAALIADIKAVLMLDGCTAFGREALLETLENYDK